MINLKILFFIFFISIFFIHFNVPYVSFYCVIGIVFLFISFLIISLFKQKSFLYFVKKITLNTTQPMILYALFVLYILVITFLLALLGNVNLCSSLVEIIYRYVFCMFFCYITVAYITYKYLKPTLIVKIIYSIWFIILLLGIIDFVSYFFNIKPIMFLLEQTHNIEMFVWQNAYKKAFVFIFPRVQSIYVEPGFFAENIFLFLPMLYSLSLSKFKIYRNNFINNLIKKSTIVLSWLNLILTFSPIWLIGCTFSTLIYFRKIILVKLKQKFALILLIVFPLTMFFGGIYQVIVKQSSDSYLGRITTVVTNIKNINDIILAEQSLGTRLSSVINQIDIGLKSPVIGHGHSNKTVLMVKQISSGNSPVAVTGEMLVYILQKDKATYQSPPFADIFVRYGIIGILLYYGFIFKTVYYLKHYKNTSFGILKDFICGLYGSILSYIVLTLYDISPGELQSCLLLGISLALIFYYKKQRKIFKYKNKGVCIYDK